MARRNSSGRGLLERREDGAERVVDPQVDGPSSASIAPAGCDHVFVVGHVDLDRQGPTAGGSHLLSRGVQANPSPGQQCDGDPSLREQPRRRPADPRARPGHHRHPDVLSPPSHVASRRLLFPRHYPSARPPSHEKGPIWRSGLREGRHGDNGLPGRQRSGACQAGADGVTAGTGRQRAERRQTCGTRAPCADPTAQHPKSGREFAQQQGPGLEERIGPRPGTGLHSCPGSGRLAGRKAVVTGADRGIGRAAAVACAQECGEVVLSYLPAEEPDAEKVVKPSYVTGEALSATGGMPTP